MEYKLVLKRAQGDDEEITLPEGVIEISDGAFKGCNNLKRVVIPEGCTRIGPSAFRDCGALEEIALPQSITFLGDYCFRGCSSLTRAVLPSKIKRLPQEAFAACPSLEHVEGGEDIEQIEREAFSGCASLREFAGRPVKNIGNRAFANCMQLERIDFGTIVTLVGEMAFRNCNNLKEANLPETAIGLKNNAFAECPTFPISDGQIVKRFPNAFPREVAQAHGVLRPIDRNALAKEFRERHTADREEFERRRDEITALSERLEQELPSYGVLDLKKRDAIVEQLEDIEAELDEINLLLAEIKNPSWETLVEEFASCE